ncbi:MAG: ferredoxin-thioredoxin reductase catalytic domain-containing protein [Candidatus Nanoarchaeia archaeon]|nr:ferredoxin-thioredoxin reductase catalytic domain-containing protein [Candidatus Nanoarchaeia archaeon]MDD5741362.1 ferredoxin-thioredoxin reductase catalytic domain-containing protein [Candidatus Nanoarchaeia archaeon]
MVRKIIEISKEEIEKQIKIWREFTEKQEKDKFILNPDKETVERLAKGVLTNEKNKEMKFCPCRMIMSDKEQDKKLVCPCSFKMQKTWKEKGECWCSLFVKAK